VQIGNYKAPWEFLVGDIGDEIILRLPFLQSIQISNLNWSEEEKRPEDMEIYFIPDSAMPAWTGSRKLNEHLLDSLNEKSEELLLEKCIVPSTSSFGANVLFTKKQDGSQRLCIDYRRLNLITIKDRAHIPDIELLKEQLRKSTIYSKFYLRDGYYNVRVKKGHEYKTALKCRYGLYEWTVVPFGLSNLRHGEPSLWFVIGSVFNCIHLFTNHRRHCLHLKWFFELSGIVVGVEGLKMAPEKVNAMQARPSINIPADIRSYLGSCVWFSAFIPDYAGIVTPLTNLTRNNTAWEWGAERE
jgi:hypothetical protein